MEKEIWKDINGYEGIYQVSNFGRIKSVERKVKCAEKLGGFRLKREKILSTDVGTFGYHRVYMQGRKYLVHRLVAKAFVPNPQNYTQVNHKDECKGNNNASNLEWCTAKYNSNYGDRTERTARSKYKQLSMFNMNGEFIRDFDSIKEASEFIGARITPKFLMEHHSIRGHQFRRKGEQCGPYIENRGKYKRK